LKTFIETKTFQNYEEGTENMQDDPVMKLCRDNHLDFTLSILKIGPRNVNCHFFDFDKYKSLNFFDKTSVLFRKQIGIVLKHRQEEVLYQLYTKQNQVEGYRRFDVAPIHPDVEVPPLAELLDREAFKQHDEVRFKLLKWMTGNQKLDKIELKDFPVNYLLDVLTLSWLSFNGFITTCEADLVLLTIENVETNRVSSDLRHPKYLNSRALHVSFLFTKFHMLLGDSMEVVGLKSMRVI
jgi:hypothetical protein